MMHVTVEKPEIKMVGISVRTNNAAEFNKMDGKIFPCVQKYFHQKLGETIPHRKHPGTTLCAYTDYESDEHGDYTYFIGEEVTYFDKRLPEGLQTLTIPKQTYVKFTTAPDPMPDVLLKAWKTILAMSSKEFGGKRNYLADFELYDERAADHSKIVMDLFIGITPK